MDYKDKIRKLLALAKSPEPEEAKLALLKARKLMAEHKLSERDLEERNTTVIKRAIGEKFSKKANSWMDPLSIVIGENYCCSAFRCKISAKTTVWHVGFIGLEGDIEICVKIFRYAVRCIKSEQKKLRKQHRDYYTPQEIAKICDSYGYGFARGVYEAFTRQNSVTSEPKQAASVVSTADKKAPPKKPVSWLTPVGAKGLMLLRCPKCKSEFVQFLREPQTTNECRKCGAKIPLDALARFEFTCPVCKKESYGRTNVEDAEIVNEKFSCVCGRSIPKLTWNPAKRCYTT